MGFFLDEILEILEILELIDLTYFFLLFLESSSGLLFPFELYGCCTYSDSFTASAILAASTQQQCLHRHRFLTQNIFVPLFY